MFLWLQNFYLIDPQLIAFCGLVLVRRVIWTLEKKVYRYYSTNISISLHILQPGLISGIYILQFCTYKTVHHCRNTNCLGAIVYYSGSKPKHLNNLMRVTVVGIWDRAIAPGRQYALFNISVSKNVNSWCLQWLLKINLRWSNLYPIFIYLIYCSISVYFLLFGLSGEPFLELTPPSPVSGKLKIVVDSKGVYRTNGPSSLPYLPTPSPGTTLASSTALSGGGGGGVANAAGTTSGIFT